MSGLSKTAQAILVAFMMVFMMAVLLWTLHSQKMDDQKKISADLSVANRKLVLTQAEQLAQQKVELERRVAQTIARSSTEAGRAFSTSQSVAATEVLITTADKLGVEIIELRSAGPASQKLQGVPVRSLPFSIKVEGDVLNLVDFVTALSQVFPAGTVKSVGIDLGASLNPQAGSPEMNGPRWSATVQLEVYTYDGGPNG